MNLRTFRMHSLLLTALLPAMSLGADLASASPPAQANRSQAFRAIAIQGVWDSTVTLTPCANPNLVLASFRALNQFNAHGSLIATSQTAQPPSLGKWDWLGGRRFRATFRFQRFGSGGVFEGLTQVTREIQLAPDGNSFTGAVATELFDLSDTLYAQGCGSEAAKRLF